MTIKNLIRDEIQNELGELHRTEVGSEDYETIVNGVTKLTDRLIELEKLEIDDRDKTESRENDYNLKLIEIDEDRKDRITKNVLTGLSIVGGIGLAIWGTVTSMKFEKEDSFTSTLGRKWVDKTISFIKK